MLGIKARSRRAYREQAEKPFWISFSDLMTALMVLFLVAMAVALIAVTHGLNAIEKDKRERDATIDSCLVDVQALARRGEFQGVTVRGDTIDFGALAQFDNDEHRLAPEQERFVREFVPQVLAVAREPTCDKWLKRVVVEGFASQVGSYLYNLNLSFRRSQRILCVLLDSQAPDALSMDDRKQIRTLFLAGGSSFNTAVKAPEEMRRVDLKLEFRELGATKDLPPDIPWDEDSKCPNDTR